MRKMMLAAVALGLLTVACGSSESADPAPDPASLVEGAGSTANDAASTSEPATVEPEETDTLGDAGSELQGDDPAAVDELLLAPTTTKPIAANPELPPAGLEGAPVTSSEIDHPNPQVALAMGDLVQRIGVDVGAIEVVSVEEVTWPDGSIGCPQPGMLYTQALVNGSRIVLEHAGMKYHYHAGRSGDPFYCAFPEQPVDSELAPPPDQ